MLHDDDTLPTFINPLSASQSDCDTKLCPMFHRHKTISYMKWFYVHFNIHYILNKKIEVMYTIREAEREVSDKFSDLSPLW